MLNTFRSILLLSFVLGAISHTAFANRLLEGVTPHKAGTYRLFTIHGSNTIGANLGPELVKSFLKTNGAKRIQQKHGEEINEHLIKAV
ncbi:MAG: hypothetical protein MI867_06955, partial [Pseudomonadales bacterium]|nr:hypothetical protein [Pseudomonadales bacterium]